MKESSFFAREEAIRRMTAAIREILADNSPSIYLYGSCVLDDFRFGWSDIDLLVLTQKRIAPTQARTLVTLRQKLSEQEPDNPYYRLFEGGMLTLQAFRSGTSDCVVYWGTSGQRMTDTHRFDSFCLAELLQSGRLLSGAELRGPWKMPTDADFHRDVQRHYEGIRRCAQTTDGSLYSFGWLLDIARGIYTLRAGVVTSKTAAAQWALDHRLCPVPDALETALMVRKNPMTYRDDSEMQRYAQTLGPDIQRFADVLEQELHAAKKAGMR